MADKPNYYAILTAEVRYDKTLKPNAKLLYAEITSLTNDKGYCWATNSYFAKLYEVSKDAISRWINDLIKKGYLKSQIIYDDDKKTVLERRLYITSKIDSYRPNDIYPIDQIVDTPIDQKVEDNIKSINIKFNKENHMKNDTKKPKKQRYGEFKNVLLTDAEVEKLKVDYGKNYDKLLQMLDEGLELHGYKYTSHSMAMRVWAKKSNIKTSKETKEGEMKVPAGYRKFEG